jgi:hypothetical protein
MKYKGKHGSCGYTIKSDEAFHDVAIVGCMNEF